MDDYEDDGYMSRVSDDRGNNKKIRGNGEDLNDSTRWNNGAPCGARREYGLALASSNNIFQQLEY